MRERLERERSRRTPRHGTTSNSAAAGCSISTSRRATSTARQYPDEANDRSTSATLERLHAAGSLGDEDHGVLREGYAFCARSFTSCV